MSGSFANPWAFPERHYQVDVDAAALLRLEGKLRAWAGVVAAQANQAKGFPDRIGTSWRGATATAIKGEMSGLGTVLDKGQSLIYRAADAVRDFKGEVEAIVQSIYLLELQWQEAHRDYLGQVSSDVVGPFPSEADRAVAKALKAANAEDWWARDNANYDRRFAGHKKSLADAARKFVRVLGECQLVKLPGPLAESARFSAGGVTAVGLPYVAKQLSPQLKLVGKYEDQALGMFPKREQAQVEGRRVAQLRNAGLELSPDDRELLAKAAKNPWFAHAYAMERGPENMAVAASVAASAVHGLKVHIPPLSAAEIAAFQAEQEAVIDAEAVVLSSASPTLGAGYAQKMIDLAKKDPAAAYGVSIAMHRGGDFAKEFEDVWTEAIYQAGRNNGNAGKGGNSALAGAVLPRDSTALYGKPEWADPMTGVLALKARDPAKAQRFFLTPDGEKNGRPKNRLDHVLHERSSKQVEPTVPASPTADARGPAVEAATTTLRDHTGPGSPGWQSAKIAGQVLTAFPQKEGSGIGGATDHEIPPAMRQSVAKIISAYLVDFVSAQPDSTRAEGEVRADTPLGSTPGQSFGVQVTPKLTEHLLAEVVQDPQAVAYLLNAELVLADASLKHAGSLLKGADNEVSIAEARVLYSTVLRQHGDFLKVLEDKIAAESKIQEVDYDAEIKAAVDAWAVVAKTGIPLAPVEGDAARGIFDEALANSHETVTAAVLTERAGLAEHQPEEESLVDRLRQLAVRRAFEDDLYFTGLVGNPAELSRHTAWKLPFLGPDFQVKPESSLDEAQWSEFIEFVKNSDSRQLGELDPD